VYASDRRAQLVGQSRAVYVVSVHGQHGEEIDVHAAELTHGRLLVSGGEVVPAERGSGGHVSAARAGSGGADRAAVLERAGRVGSGDVLDPPGAGFAFLVHRAYDGSRRQPDHV